MSVEYITMSNAGADFSQHSERSENLKRNTDVVKIRGHGLD